MLLRITLWIYIACVVSGVQDEESEKNHFGKGDISGTNDNDRRGFEKVMRNETREGITFIDKPDFNLQSHWFSANGKKETQIQRSSGNSHKSSSFTTGENTGLSHTNQNTTFQDDMLALGNGGIKKNSSLDGNLAKQNKNVAKGDSRRNLLPEKSCGVYLQTRILGGTITHTHEFPWLALLQYRNRDGEVTNYCSGSLISSRYVLTAAHCTIGVGVVTRKLKLEKVRLGEWNLKRQEDCPNELCHEQLQDISIDEIINHPKYKPRQKSQTDDIALLRLKNPAKMNMFVQPICLPFGKVAETNFEGRRLYVSGWGKTSNAKNSSSHIKMKVDIPVVAWEKCRTFYESFYSGVKISRTQMCAGGEEGKDTCQGDSGSPLMSNEKFRNDSRWFAVGIVSSGPAACGVKDRPSLFTNIASYSEWILDNIQE